MILYVLLHQNYLSFFNINLFIVQNIKFNFNMSDKQIIFVLDLDGTIIGDCSYQCDIYNIDNISKKYNKDSLLNCYKPDSKLIRAMF